jgi:hypothetical protein
MRGCGNENLKWASDHIIAPNIKAARIAILILCSDGDTNAFKPSTIVLYTGKILLSCLLCVYELHLLYYTTNASLSQAIKLGVTIFM